MHNDSLTWAAERALCGIGGTSLPGVLVLRGLLPTRLHMISLAVQGFEGRWVCSQGRFTSCSMTARAPLLLVVSSTSEPQSRSAA